MRTLIALILALSFRTASAQDSGNSLDQIELNAWNYYCQNELDGDVNATLCDCVLAKQYEMNDPRIIKGSLLQMVDNDQNASDADNQTAQDALTEMYSGDLQGPRSDMTDFNSTLNNNIKACKAKPQS